MPQSLTNLGIFTHPMKSDGYDEDIRRFEQANRYRNRNFCDCHRRLENYTYSSWKICTGCNCFAELCTCVPLGLWGRIKEVFDW